MLLGILSHLEMSATSVIGYTTPSDRARGINQTFSRGGSGASWIILALGVLVVGGIILGYIVSQRRDQTKAKWQRFWTRASDTGLGDEEGGLLRNLAIAAGLANPESIFTSQDVFFRGLSALENSTADAGIFGRAKTTACSSCRFFQSLQEKLGFTQIEPDGAMTDSPSLGPIKAGVTLGVTRDRMPQDFEVQLTRDGDEPGQLTVSCRNIPDVEVGESWRLRYPEGGILWEFDARVVRLDHEHVFLRHSGQVRHVDRRKFVRVPVSRPARVALFPFERHGAGATPPRFCPARLLELAGPGVLLEANMHAKKGDKVLVVIDLDDRSVEGLGVVRRGSETNDDTGSIAIELVALSTSQISELARETNAFATREAARQREQKASSLETAAQET